jgi:hypothetical protein
VATLVTNPGVRIVINTRAAGAIDVTNDIEAVGLNLQENSFHTLHFNLLNPNNKYSSVFTPNDTVVVQMKRLKWIQVFAGYLDSVPYFSVFQRSVSVTATCTLKRLWYHFWDPGLPSSLDLLSQALDPTQTTTGDAGMSAVVKALLTKVAGWPDDQIHIGDVPTDWMSKIASIYATESQAIDQIAAAAGGAYSNGQSLGGGSGAAPPDQNGGAAPPGTDLPHTSGQGSHYRDIDVPPGGNTQGAIAGCCSVDEW